MERRRDTGLQRPRLQEKQQALPALPLSLEASKRQGTDRPMELPEGANPADTLTSSEGINCCSKPPGSWCFVRAAQEMNTSSSPAALLRKNAVLSPLRD